MPLIALIADLASQLLAATTPSGKAFDEGMRNLIPTAQTTGIKIVAVLALIVLFGNLRRRHISSRTASADLSKGSRVRARRRR